jgi:type I restriction enzyme, S subunit
MSASKLKPYPNYTESNSEFIPQYPSHWELKRMQWIGKFSASGIDKKSVEAESDCLMVNYTDVYGNETAEVHSNQVFMKTTATRQKIIEHHLEKGDMLFTPSSETADDIGVSAVAVEDMPEIVYSYHLTRFRPSMSLGVNFSRFFCNSTPVLSQLTAVARGTTRQILSRGDFNTLNVAIPPEEERKKIGQFLSEKTIQINTSIKKLENNLSLIKEKRSALITQAVTKGLESNVEMKDSGIDGIGKIPNSWVVGKIKHFCRNLNYKRLPLSGEERSYRQGNYDYYGASGVIDHIDDYLFDEPTVLIAEDGANLVLRNLPLAIFAEGKYWVNNHAHILKPNDGAYRFWCELLESQDFNPLVSGSAQPKLTADAIMNYVIAIPDDINERYAIQDYTISTNSKYLPLIKKIREEITRLQEYRTSLISAVITGKIDVRGQA